jgi:exopolysaccharide biosynthesis protein PssK
VLPMQVAFLENECLNRTAELVAKHPDVTLLARGVVAQHVLRRYFSGARIELAPDMAFMLGLQQRQGEPLCDIVWIARTDQDRSNDQTEIAARLASQPAEKFLLPEFADGIEINFVVKQRPPTVLLTDWHSLFFENEQARLAFRRLDFDARSNVYVSRAIHMLSLGHIVITDRLHGHVMCVLLGIPHIFLNDDSGKNWNFYESWTREAALCRVAPTPAEAWALARAALLKLKALKSSDLENWSWQGLSTAAGPGT